MKAIIPVAGMGTRLRPHTHTCPKVLFPVAGKPIVAHILDELVRLNFDEVTFIIGYKGDMIHDFIKKNYSFKANFVEQEKMLGLGHAISLAKKYHYDDDDVFIVLGDTVFEADIKTCFENNVSALGVQEVADPRRFGVVVLDEKNRIKQLIEKPEEPVSNLAIVGLYYIKQPKLLFDCLDKMIEQNIRTKSEYQLTDALQMMIADGYEMTVFKIDGWYDCGKKETVLQTNMELLELLDEEKKLPPPQAYPDSIIIPPVAIHPTAKITNSVIGPHVTVSENTVINTSLIRNSVIGENCELKSLLLEESLVGDNCRVSGDMRSLNIGDSSELSFTKK
ncbi:NTP transferase domain-containing protein [Candidatus Sumerlaeota bacterium]|nr:sugar phosphate nucleotidyltransferase [Candidatus Sumerlaeales bacterium]NLD62091.1 NTP transferase domain-containing protein [Candidatus Sumerlaeota bacterium]